MKPMMLRSLGGIALIGLLSLAALGLSSPPGDAAENYQRYCASCHGEQLNRFVAEEWKHGKAWHEVYRSMAQGYPDGGMPAFDTTFTDKELAELTDYILEGIENKTKAEIEQQRPDFSGVIESEDLAFRLDTVAAGKGLRIPWGLAFLPDGSLLITDRGGTLFHHRADRGLQKIEGVPKVRAKNQGGLLDVELHPDFAQNRWVYLSFSKPAEQGDDNTTAVLRGRLQGNRLVDTSLIFEAKPYVSTRHHYGSRLVFDGEGYLYISVGDRGRRDQHPQYLSNYPGKIHRLHDDGRIPHDNPFVDRAGAVSSIWSYGHRNPQGLAIHPETGALWENEHGPRGGDEINHIQPGLNYGWPVISYGINYNGTTFTDLTEKEGMEQPLHYWVPAIGVCGLAIVGGDRYPAWHGDFLSGSLAFEYLHRTKMEHGKVVGQEKLLPNLGRVRCIKMGPDGYLYITKESPGYVLRIVPMG
jgi:aldose sugar dehydrogenase